MVIINVLRKIIHICNIMHSGKLSTYIASAPTAVSIETATAMTPSMVIARPGSMLKECGLVTARRRSTDTNTRRAMEKLTDRLTTQKNTPSMTMFDVATLRTIPQTQMAESATASANM